MNINITEIIQRGLQAKAEIILKEEIMEAQKRVEERMKGMAANVVISLFDHFAVTELKDKLIIEVNHKFPTSELATDPAPVRVQWVEIKHSENMNRNDPA